jgi:cytochrome c peroxidase
MNKKILMILMAILLGLVVMQGSGLFPQEVSALASDYYSPFDLAYSPDGTMIAVTDLTKAKLNIITASTGTIARTVSLNGQPKGLVWSGNTRVYVAEYNAGTVAEIDPSNGSILRRFTTGRKPVGVTVASGKLVVSDFGLSKVTVVDLSTGNILGDVTVKNYPYFVEATTTGAYAIVGHATPSGNAMSSGYASSVSFVDVNARTVTANIALPAGSGNVRKIKCSPDGKWAYVLHELGRVTLPTTQITKGWVNTDALTIIDVAQRNIYTTVLLDTLYEGAADPWGLAISSDSNTLWASISGTHQVFKIDLYNLHQLLTGNIPGGGGGTTWYNIVNKNSGKCLDVNGGGTADGAQLIQWPSNGGDNQRWATVDAGGGYKKLQVKFDSKFADNQGSTAQGALIVQWSSSASNNQQWTMTDRGSGYYSFTCRTGGLAMDITGGSTADAATVCQNTYTGAASQLWSLVPAGTTGGTPTLTYRSKAAYSKPYSDIWFAIKADSTKRALLKNNLGALWSAGLLTKIKLPGQGPRGISMSADGTRVAVGAYFAGQVYTINTSTNAIAQTISLGTQPAEDNVRRGERTFHDASTTTQKWLSCASCHPEGRADGFDWDMPNDGVGNTKNTKTMYKAFEIEPAMWRGVRADAATGINAGFKFIKFRTPTQQELDDVAAYFQSFTEDISPYRNTDGSMTADALAGKTLFQSSGTQCSTCHNGTNLSDCAIHNVGTKDSWDIDGNYVTPPLEELWRTAPYLHDGSAPTMRDVLTTRNVGNTHGTTSQLTSTQLDQLVAFLLQVKAGEVVNNLALGKTASADSVQTGHAAGDAVDGNQTTRWCANDGGLNHWWTVDLGSSYSLAATEVMWETAAKIYKYKVETSTDNVNWTLKVDKTNNTNSNQTQRDNFTGTARYVRITVTGLDPACWASFFEFRVF